MKVHLGPYGYDVQFADLGDDDDGESDPETRKIRIHTKLDNVEVRDTILHEFLHSIVDLRRLSVDEFTINILATDLCQMLEGFWVLPPIEVEPQDLTPKGDDDGL